VLTQAREPLIRRTFEALQGARRVIVHLYNATAPVMRKVVLGLDEDGIVELATSQARLFNELAAQQPGTEWVFQYSPEMFSGTELPFAKRVVDAVTDVWQPTPQRKCIVNLPSTVEHSTPNIFADMIEWMHRNLARRDSIVLSVHPHNDRGTGTAAGEFAVMAGADRLEGCLFGNGERTGNLDLVNVALNLYSQGVPRAWTSPTSTRSAAPWSTATSCRCTRAIPTSATWSTPRSPARTRTRSRRRSRARKEGDIWDMPYLPLDPKDLGRSYEAVIRVNSQSGKGGISYLLESRVRAGAAAPPADRVQPGGAGRDGRQRQGAHRARDPVELFQQEYGLAGIDGGATSWLEEAAPPARASSCRPTWWSAAVLQVRGAGNGPIDAFVEGLAPPRARPMRVLDYHEHAIGRAPTPRPWPTSNCASAQRTLFGVGMDANIVSASLKAIVSGLQRAAMRARTNTKETAWQTN
jgi:2-isopropylmalate synthase